MKMVAVFNANGDKILACDCDLDYYQSIGWKTEAPAKEKTSKAKTETAAKEKE